MADASPLMAGKRGIVMGVANARSLAWGVAHSLADHGADLAFTFQGNAIEKRIRPLAESVGSDFVLPCDVTDEASVDATFEAIAERWGHLDFLVHAIAYSDKEELKGRYLDTTLENFQNTLQVSCYSFTALCQRAPIWGPSVGVPHYNVMGVAKAALESSVRYLAADLGDRNIRVNAISAGPVKTLAASGIGDFRYIMKWNEYNAPLRRNVTIDEVGGAATYLLSELGRGVTGEVHHVDCGYHIVGMKRPDAPDISVV